MKGKVLAINISIEKGTMKEPIRVGKIIPDFGIENDAHGGDWHRQISLLDMKSIKKMEAKGLDLDYGDFAENITTEGLVLHELPIGTQMKIGENVVLEVTQIGKECHHGCEIAQKVGSCVMPLEGIFAKVISGGEIEPNDTIDIIFEKENGVDK